MPEEPLTVGPKLTVTDQPLPIHPSAAIEDRVAALERALADEQEARSVLEDELSALLCARLGQVAKIRRIWVRDDPNSGTMAIRARLISGEEVGARDLSDRRMGFAELGAGTSGRGALERAFTPEFRNRLDAIVPFTYLGRETVARVVDKFILQLELQLADQNVHIQFDSDARGWLADKGYDKLYGARPMARLVQEKIKQPLAEELLFGKLVNGGEVKVRIKDNAPAFEVIPAPPKAPRKKKAPAKAKEEGQPEAKA